MPVRGPSTGFPETDAMLSVRLHEAAQSAAPEALTQAAVQLVSSAFIMPVLESLHDSPFQTGPLAPGTAEKRFRPLLDQHLADQIATAANFPLVRAIIERYRAAAGAFAPVKEAPDAP
jgi:Rod binding domain-containing protein